MHPEFQPIQLSVVIPTFNERENVKLLHERLANALSTISWEAVFVDDFSPDGTSEAVRALARQDARVRLIFRHNRRGLSSAVVEGCLAASADIVAVMDGDLQHDEQVLMDLYKSVASGAADIATASRFLGVETVTGLASAKRQRLSERGIQLANRLLGLHLTDPLTGFFVTRRSVFLGALDRLSELGFKILLDLIVSSEPRPRVVELPFNFQKRLHGESKLDNAVMYDFLLFLIDKTLGRVLPVPARFYSYGVVGGFGVFVHMATLFVVHSLAGLTFSTAQGVSTVVALISNFTLNNFITYFDKRLFGLEFVRGFLVYALVCSVGVVGNIGVASVLHERFNSASYVVPAFVGILVGVVWNFAASNVFVWKQKSRKLPTPAPVTQPSTSQR